MRSVIACNDDWIFNEGFSEALTRTLARGEQVTLPHTAVELPFSYFDETAYQRPFVYQKLLRADPSWDGKEVSLVFDGAMADAVVYLNGEQLGAHKDGYTPFEVRLTDKLQCRREPAGGQDRRLREPGNPAVRRPHRLSHLCRHLSRCLAEGHAARLDRQRQDRDA